MSDLRKSDELLVTCPQCGRQQSASARFCAQCGSSLQRFDTAAGAVDAAFLESSDLTGKLLAGKYRLLAKVGEGGMGTVYKAEHAVLGRLVAVKILHPEMLYDASAVARFKGEARAASRLNHPNLISVMDFGQSPDGLSFLVTEFLHGLPLSRLIEDGTSLGAQFAYTVLIQTLDGMREAHALGIVHRDLKPENIFLERFRDGSVMAKVLDFGVAKDTQAAGPGLTSPGMVCGTPEYMAPEQAMGSDVSPATDVYALGIVFYELLAGANPFERPSPAESMIAHVRDPAPRLSSIVSDLPGADMLDSIVNKAIAKDPKARYPDAGVFLDNLRSWGESVGLGEGEVGYALKWPDEERRAEPTESSGKNISPFTSESVEGGGTHAILAMLEADSPERIRIEDNLSSGPGMPENVPVPAHPDRDAGKPAPDDYLQERGLVGRGHLLSDLKDSLAVVGHAKIVGPPGIGKTAIFSKLVEQWNSKGWSVLLLNTDRMATPPAPLAPIRRFLTSTKEKFHDIWQRLPSLDQTVLEAVIDTGMPLTGLDPEVAVREMTGSWLTLLGQMDETTLLLVDDLDRMDRMSMRLVEAAEERVRVGDLPCSMATSGTSFSRKDDSLLIEMTPLNPADSISLAMQVMARLGAQGGGPVQFEIPQSAAGNPFFIEQAVRAEIEGTLPNREVSSPTDILDARLSRLSNADRWLLQVTCIIDEPCPKDDISFVVDRLVRQWETRLDLGGNLEERLVALERSGLLTCREGRWQAAHEIISQAVVNLAPAEFRRKTHEILMQRSSRLVSKLPSQTTCQVARHAMAAEAGDPEALALCLQAGAVARRTGDDGEAAKFLGFVTDRLRRRWAQGGIGDKDLVCRLGATARALASCLVSDGDRQAAKAVLTEALMVVRSEGLDHFAAGILLDLAGQDLAQGQIESGTRELAEALDLVAGRHWYLDALAAMHLADLLARRGRFEAALEQYGDAAVAAGTNPGQGNSLLWKIPLRLAQLHEGWGKIDHARDFAQHALLNADEQSAPSGRIKSHEVLARLESGAGRWEQCRYHAEAIVEIALDLPDRQRAARAALDVSRAWMELGAEDRAKENAAFAKSLARAIGDEQTVARATRFLALVG